MQGFLRQAFPVLGGIIGGPAGKLAAGALMGAATKLGLPKTATETDIERYLEDHPEKGQLLQELQNELLLKTEELHLKKLEIESQDRKDARAMYKNGKDKMHGFVATSAVLIFIGSLAAVFYFSFVGKDLNNPVMMMILGAVLTKYGSVVDFFFGSSSPPKQEKEKK